MNDSCLTHTQLAERRTAKNCQFHPISRSENDRRVWLYGSEPISSSKGQLWTTHFILTESSPIGPWPWHSKGLHGDINTFFFSPISLPRSTDGWSVQCLTHLSPKCCQSKMKEISRTLLEFDAKSMCQTLKKPNFPAPPSRRTMDTARLSALLWASYQPGQCHVVRLRHWDTPFDSWLVIYGVFNINHPGFIPNSP